LNDDFDVETVV